MPVFFLRSCTVRVGNIIVQLMHTNYYKIVKLLKLFKIITVGPTCFGLHKPSSGSYSLCFDKVAILSSVTYIVMWSYRSCGCVCIVQCAKWIVRFAHCKSTLIAGRNKHAATIPITSPNDMCNRNQYCNFGEAQAESSLMMVYVYRNMLEQLL